LFYEARKGPLLFPSGQFCEIAQLWVEAYSDCLCLRESAAKPSRFFEEQHSASLVRNQRNKGAMYSGRIQVRICISLIFNAYFFSAGYDSTYASTAAPRRRRRAVATGRR
jgi:hypothetical protein